METYDPTRTGNYYILGDTNAEMIHLIITDQTFNKAMGGLLPEQPASSLAHIRDVLDMACGPGGWALELAQANPHMRVTGIDISEGMIEHANVQAHASGLDNARFKVASVIQPLEFPNESFDLVNIRHLEFVIPVATWPQVLKEMFRITRRGGTIRFTDTEWGVSNSLALEELRKLDMKAAQKFGMSHSSDGRNIGITPWLRRLLQDVGCVNVQERPIIMDLSSGEEAHQGAYQMYTIGYQLMEPFLLSTQVTTQQELERLQQQLAVEMLEDEFRGIIYTLTVWGTKPQAR